MPQLLDYDERQLLKSGADVLRAGDGRGRILFAIDWPFVRSPPGVEWMETVPLCDEDKAKILSGNARRLLKI